MMNRRGRKPHYHGPPPFDGEERRQQHRREDDVETREIVEHAVQDAPIVHQLVSSGRAWALRASFALAGALFASAGTAIGMSVHGPKQDFVAVNARADSLAAADREKGKRIDSLELALSDIKRDLATLKLLACISAARINANVATAGGCPK